MSKFKITDELMNRALAVFKAEETIYSGEGLTRKELRALERAGMVKSAEGGGIHGRKLIWKAKEALWQTTSILNLSRADL